MFYSKCKKCGTAHRWLTQEESLDPEIVAKNKATKLTLEEVEKAETVIDAYCTDCEPKPKKKKE